jgi:transcriptional regulator with XRE-family HTH domain
MVVPMEQTTRSPMETARLAKGLTHRKLAEIVTAAGEPVSHSQLVRIENGQSSPRPALRVALAKALFISPDDLP